MAQSHSSVSVTLVNRFLYCVSDVWKHSPNILKCGGKLPTPTTYTDACVYLALITNIIHQVESVLDLQHSNRHSYTRERTFTLYSTKTLEAGVFHVLSPQKTNMVDRFQQVAIETANMAAGKTKEEVMFGFPFWIFTS